MNKRPCLPDFEIQPSHASRCCGVPCPGARQSIRIPTGCAVPGIQPDTTIPPEPPVTENIPGQAHSEPVNASISMADLVPQKIGCFAAFVGVPSGGPHFDVTPAYMFQRLKERWCLPRTLPPHPLFWFVCPLGIPRCAVSHPPERFLAGMPCWSRMRAAT